MPRPIISKAGASSANQSSNPFTNWLNKRKERRLQAEDEASRLITNKIAENESIMVDKLNSIDFFHSRLPKEILEAKSDPEQPYGDLELATQMIIQKLTRNPQIIKMDIRKFDQKLLTLVLLFKQTVEQGDTRAAYAAKCGLLRAVNDIRSRIPQNQPELAKQFVEVNTDYLDQWITLITLAQVADRTKQNVDNQRKRHDESLARYNEENAQWLKRIQADSEDNKTLKQLMERTGDKDRSKWSEEERKMHRDFVERRLERVNMDLNGVRLQQLELDLSSQVNKVEIFYTKVATVPVVTDPDLMNKYREGIEKLFEEMSKSDVELDEMLKSMDDIEGRLQQLNNAPGSLRAREVAAEEAEKLVEDLKKMQSIKSGQSMQGARKIRESLGIYSEEELEVLKKQAELEQQRALEMSMELLREQEEEREMLAN